MAVDYEQVIWEYKDYQSRARHILNQIGDNPSQQHKVDKLMDILQECKVAIDLWAMVYSDDQLHPGKFI